MLTALLLAAALQQGPGQTPPAPRENTAFDTSGAAINALGRRVADVKSGLEQYRRAVFNGVEAEVLGNARSLKDACHAMDSTAAAIPRKICRHCAAPRVQEALNGYRTVLPVVARTGQRCAAGLGARLRRSDAAKALRADVRVIGNPLVAGLAQYERRLSAVLEALRGPVRSAPVPRRPAPPG